MRGRIVTRRNRRAANIPARDANNESLLVDDADGQPWGRSGPGVDHQVYATEDVIGIEPGADPLYNETPTMILELEQVYFPQLGYELVNGTEESFQRPLVGVNGVPGADSRGAGLPRDNDHGGFPGQVNANPYTIGAVIAPEDFTLRGHHQRIGRKLEGNMGPVGGKGGQADYQNQLGQAFAAGLVPPTDTNDIYAALVAGWAGA